MASPRTLNKGSKPPPKIVSASGSTIRLHGGKVLLDACSGVGVSCFGYRSEEVARAIEVQMATVPYAYSSAFSADICDVLAKEILQDCPGGLEYVAFFSSGSESTEAALKIVTQYWREKGEDRTKFISRHHSYHGSTLGALSVSGHLDRRAPYSSWLSKNVSFVETCYPFRGQPEDMTEDGYVASLKHQLEAEFHRLGPSNVAAFVAETMPGTTLGCVPASKGYFRAVREVCDKHGALLVLDEVMCGMGRTGSYHAWQQEEGFRGPDVQMISKSLSGGFIPLSAILVHGTVVEAIRKGSGSLNHSQTFQAHPLACAAALEVQRKLRRDGTMSNIVEVGRYLGAALEELILPLPYVGDVRGRGLLWAVEFVADKETKGEFPARSNFAQSVVAAAFENGLYVHGASARSGSFDVQYVMLAPWFLITKPEAMRIVNKLKIAIQDASREWTQSGSRHAKAREAML